MSKSLKIILVGAAILMSVCIVCGLIFVVSGPVGLRSLARDDPEAARNIADSMLDYTLPPGFLEHGGLNIGLIKMVLITPSGKETQIHEDNVILMTSFPSGFNLSEDQFRIELQMSMMQSSSGVSTMEFITEESRTIQSEDVTFSLFQSFGKFDQPTPMMFSSVFPGKSGDVMIMVAGPISSWDQRMIDAFISSIN